MHDEFEMSMIGELKFFLGLQIKQMEDEIFFNQSNYIKEILKKFGLEDPKPTKMTMSTEIKLTKDAEADSVDRTKYRGAKMRSEYQQDYKKTRAYAQKIYNDPNMTEELRDIYRDLETRYVHEKRTIDLSFYRDLSDDSVAKFANIGFDCFLSLDDQICPRTIHEKVDKEGKTIHKLPNQIETNELFDHLRPCELVIRENVYSAIGNRDHTQAIIALMLYFLENGQPFKYLL
uniref:Retrovirus-related Pol polyprotein from transposon TNT 1-94 n=1 Tax=Tanacetum cinerariifolium TaxID=118510 RepID=A0A6L2JX07_TANCI|nr:retrovirus-related Pol polyprotein from transposon TNT 1-94 [Tanacetum cinerariifolium]